jgi:hypothetical protein
VHLCGTQQRAGQAGVRATNVVEPVDSLQTGTLQGKPLSEG